MIMTLLLKFSSPNKTSKLTLCRNKGKTTRQAARHESVEAGTYVFDRVIHVHESHPEVKGLIGSKILVFRRKDSTGKVFVYPGSANMIPVRDAVVVSAPDFLEISAGVVRGTTTLEVKSTFFLWGAQPIKMLAIPMVYRHLFEGSLEVFSEPTQQWQREEEQRRQDALIREEARRRAEAELREATLRVQAETARREAQAQAERQAAKARQQAANQPRTVTPSTRIVHRSLQGSSARRDDDDSLADFMFMSMFPEVAPLYRPNSFLAWYLWAQEQGNRDNVQENRAFTGAGGKFDGGGASGDWQQGVPGFPDAVSQRITQRSDGQRVELLDANGRSVGSFVVTENNGQTQFTVPGGHVFTVADQAKPSIHYENESGKQFHWDGEAEPVVESVRDSNQGTSAYQDTSSYAGNSFFEPSNTRNDNTDSYASSPTRDDSYSMDSNTSY